ncbi:hypothetical protein [Crocinitomix catalasitica]|uniref:hypothetical protein n=1 Tax=Crocinitomix catalasitica TaxID=184607 RepID=UPI000481788C|nr:hypothetical protein [Crocinitomix catalasitica]
MSGGAGHIMDMINRMKQNRSAKTSNRQKFEPNSNNSSAIPNHRTEFKKVPHEELVAIKRKIHKELKRDKQKQLYLSIIVLLLILVVFYILF